MTLEESVQHVVMEAIQEVGGVAHVMTEECQGREHFQGRGNWTQALPW